MRSLLAVALFFFATLAASAHEQRVGPNGGALVDAGTYHIELVTAGQTVQVFVSDANDKALSASGFKALAILAVDGKSTRVALEASPDGSRLVGQAGAPLPGRVKGAVQLTGSDGKTATGRIN